MECLTLFLFYAMKKTSLYFFAVIILGFALACGRTNVKETRVRPLKDTVGFAQYTWQIDSLMSRMTRTGRGKSNNPAYRFAICPHDDYTYVGALYPELLANVKATTIILLGVAHSAAKMGIEDSIVFETFDYWKGPWKNVPVSDAREKIFSILKDKFAMVSDTLHVLEHSLESMIPYFQYYNREVSIIPVLVPAMSRERQAECGRALADAIKQVAAEKKWEWGRDYAIVATTDAVHYGNEDWGGKDMAPYGCDDEGNEKALEHEKEIVDSCLRGELTVEKIRKFNSYTLSDINYKDYKWTWCGRYSVPVAMYTAFYLNEKEPLSCEYCDYSSSITADHIPVDDLRMGRTAIATKCHWVGYAAAGYK